MRLLSGENIDGNHEDRLLSLVDNRFDCGKRIYKQNSSIGAQIRIGVGS